MLEREGYYYLGDIVNKFLPGVPPLALRAGWGTNVFIKAFLPRTMRLSTSQWYLDNCF